MNNRIAASCLHGRGRGDRPGDGGSGHDGVAPDKLCYCTAVAHDAGEATMKLHHVKECLDVHKADISGSVYDDVNTSGCSFTNVNMSGATFDDVNMSGWKVHNVNLAGLKIVNANLAGASITQGRMEGMTIDGILVSDLLEAYRACRPAEDGSK
jgi:hypothetical protein